ncbi:aminoacylase-1-like [Mizuhopecten yessoensis]|uniref:N-acyl-aliphatic-L-amino acid amidohydrolase n=1 Tax=Mizuhopecten yessoensis TaxID=6573 RepID=A0A210PF45_MIZYE|nr:aminoacylase-1-like [Mizuhopecten yessoensis]OWF35113.1 Aminoacylase-1 [Mizuhopecten yessoensis]
MPEGALPKKQKCEDLAVTKFREYIRIRSVHPDPDYDGAISFLRNYAEEIGLPFQTVEVHPGRLVAIMTWEGLDPSLPSIMLNSHTDVVPVFTEHWKVDPFAAEKMENGDIYGRGTQDMKCNAIIFLEAVRRIKTEGQRLNRTIHLTFVPDEEIGGILGMAKFVVHEEFTKLNVGFAFDEGLANPTDAFTVFYGERAPWWVRVKCPGKPGHGSRFIEDTAAEKFRRIINSFLDFRAKEEKKLNGNACLKLGDVTTVNLTNVQGGVQFNVVPMEMYAGFDVRIAPTVDLNHFEDKIKNWCAEAGDDVTYEFLQKCMIQETTPVDKSQPWWKTFSSVCENMGLKLETEIFPAATDSRFLREIGIPALGFSPMNNTPILLHDHNEFLNENIFLKGIDIYAAIIPPMANLSI